MAIKKIEVPVYRLPLIFVDSHASMKKLVGKENYEEEHMEASAGVTMASTKGLIVAVFDAEPSTLVHELAHLTFEILHITGVPVESGEANEAFCYLQGALFDEALKFFKF